MNREVSISEIVEFITAANKQFEEGGIMIEEMCIRRDQKTGRPVGRKIRYRTRPAGPTFSYEDGVFSNKR